MSVTEALAVLHGGIMKIDPQNPGMGGARLVRYVQGACGASSIRGLRD